MSSCPVLQGFSVEGQENIQEVLTKQLVLCQYVCALSILRIGRRTEEGQGRGKGKGEGEEGSEGRGERGVWECREGLPDYCDHIVISSAANCTAV